MKVYKYFVDDCRLSTITKADRIVYVSQGAVLEQGTHDELMAARGPYWQLVQDDSNSKPPETTPADDDTEPDAEQPVPLQRFYRGTSVRGWSRVSHRPFSYISAGTQTE